MYRAQNHNFISLRLSKQINGENNEARILGILFSNKIYSSSSRAVSLSLKIHIFCRFWRISVRCNSNNEYRISHTREVIYVFEHNILQIRNTYFYLMFDDFASNIVYVLLNFTEYIAHLTEKIQTEGLKTRILKRIASGILIRCSNLSHSILMSSILGY